MTPDFVFACGVELGVVRPHGDGRAKHKARLRGALLGVVRAVEGRMCALRSVRSVFSSLSFRAVRVWSARCGLNEGVILNEGDF